MLSTWPRMTIVLPRGSERLDRVVHDRVDVARHGAEVAVLHVRVDVVDRLHVVVDHHGQLARARDRRDVCRAAAAPRGAGGDERDVAERPASDSIRYCGVWTSRRGSCTPFCGLSQKFGAVWPLAASDDQQVAGDVALREADLAAPASRSTSTCSSGASKTWWTCTSTAPGMLPHAGRRSARRSRSSPCASGPTTCTSIGAGRPKLRIWLTMSAGWKKNVSPGNSPCSAAAQRRQVLRGRPGGPASARRGCRRRRRRWSRLSLRRG